MRRARLQLLIPAVLVLAGCGSSTTVVSQSTPSSGSSSTSTTTTGASSTTTSSTRSATSGAASGRCAAADLQGSLLGQQGAMGRGELGFALRNVSGHSCHTFGYPGVQFLSATGTPLPTVSTRTTHDVFGSAPLAGFELPAGQSASFRLGVTHGIASSAGCHTAVALQVIPPDDTHTLRIAIPGGAYECGTATVTPLRLGTSAYP